MYWDYLRASKYSNYLSKADVVVTYNSERDYESGYDARLTGTLDVPCMEIKMQVQARFKRKKKKKK